MENLKNIDTQELLDRLSQYTNDYKMLMLKGTKEEFEQCKNSINLIQEELTLRKQSQNRSGNNFLFFVLFYKALYFAPSLIPSDI